MSLRIVVVEDEFSILMDITRRLEFLGFEVVGSALNYEEALVEILEHKPDILLLDINLNANKTGIDISRKVQENFPLPVIFLTASSDKTTFEEALSTNPMGFIVKPFKDEDLRNNIELAYAKFHASGNQQKIEVKEDTDEKQFFLKHNNGIENVDILSIEYLESMDNYVKIHCEKQKFVINSTLKSVISQLPEKYFCRVHKSFVVSKAQIKSIDGNMLTLKNGEVIPIGKTYKADFLQKIQIIE